MCGILASVNCEDWVSENSLSHRGPDQKFSLRLKNVAVDFYRLAIIGDLNDGEQPFVGRTSRYMVWCNGEIFNYKDLAESYSIDLKTGCDIEVVPILIEILGIKEALSKLRGFFSMIIWDCDLDQLYLSIDHFGIKPLYYCLAGNKLTISSELRAFKKHKINDLAVKQYFETLSSIAPQTLIANVYALEPGQVIKFDISDNANKINSENYWKIDLERIGSENISEEKISNNLHQAFGRNSISDYPVSNLLSGGIDSSVIALYNQEGIETNIFFNYGVIKRAIMNRVI
ncbi:asparagine synthetase B [Schleiferiaceae bacterium]|nr:asparagine synthetase B [Schleiferiaceae bacterium]